MCTTFCWPVHIDIPMFMKPEAELAFAKLEAEKALAKKKTPEQDAVEETDSSQEFAKLVGSIPLPELELTASQQEFEKCVAALPPPPSASTSSAMPPPPVPPKRIQKSPNSGKAKRKRGRIFNADDDDSVDEADLLSAFEQYETTRAFEQFERDRLTNYSVANTLE